MRIPQYIPLRDLTSPDQSHGAALYFAKSSTPPKYQDKAPWHGVLMQAIHYNHSSPCNLANFKSHHLKDQSELFYLLERCTLHLELLKQLTLGHPETLA
jgi:hypothetical protein